MCYKYIYYDVKIIGTVLKVPEVRNVIKIDQCASECLYIATYYVMIHIINYIIIYYVIYSYDIETIIFNRKFFSKVGEICNIVNPELYYPTLYTRTI